MVEIKRSAAPPRRIVSEVGAAAEGVRVEVLYLTAAATNS